MAAFVSVAFFLLGVFCVDLTDRLDARILDPRFTVPLWALTILGFVFVACSVLCWWF